MADKIFRPRRGSVDYMSGSTGGAVVLAKGEMFVEYTTADAGASSNPCNIKIGDGSTKYSSLPYALGYSAPVTFTAASSSSSNETLLNNIVSGASMATLFGNIKTLLSNLNDSVTQLNNDNSSVQSSIDTLLEETPFVHKFTIDNTMRYINITYESQDGGLCMLVRFDHDLFAFCISNTTLRANDGTFVDSSSSSEVAFIAICKPSSKVISNIGGIYTSSNDRLRIKVSLASASSYYSTGSLLALTQNTNFTLVSVATATS